MSTQKSIRLNLAGQTEKDPNWHLALDQGFIDADLRLLHVRSELDDAGGGTDYGLDPNQDDDPVGSAVLPADYIGQIYVNDGISTGFIDPPVVWIAFEVGTPIAGAPGTPMWTKMAATSIEASPAIDGNTDLQVILEAHQTALEVEASLPRGHLKGLRIARVSSTEASISEGECRDDLDGANMTMPEATWTKDFADGGWVAAENNSCLPNVVNPSEGDHLFVFLMTDSDGVEVPEWGVDNVLAATNLKGEVATAAWNIYRHIGFLRMTSATEMTDDIRDGDDVLYTVPVEMVSPTQPSASEYLQAVDAPTGVRVKVSVSFNGRSSNIDRYISVYSPLQGTPTISDYDPLTMLSVASKAAFATAILTDTAQVAHRSTGSFSGNTNWQGATHGYSFRRGQDD